MPITTSPWELFDIKAFDSDTAQTLSVVVDLHPGQGRMINYLLNHARFQFHDRDQLIRWCVAWGLQALFGPPLSAEDLAEAKNNIALDERFQAQKDCLSESIEKYLNAGETENARRAVANAWESYSRIDHPYWRDLYLSTLEYPNELLRRRGIQFTPTIQDGDIARRRQHR